MSCIHPWLFGLILFIESNKQEFTYQLLTVEWYLFSSTQKIHYIVLLHLSHTYIACPCTFCAKRNKKSTKRLLFTQKLIKRELWIIFQIIDTIRMERFRIFGALKSVWSCKKTFQFINRKNCTQINTRFDHLKCGWKQETQFNGCFKFHLLNWINIQYFILNSKLTYVRIHFKNWGLRELNVFWFNSTLWWIKSFLICQSKYSISPFAFSMQIIFTRFCYSL